MTAERERQRYRECRREGRCVDCPRPAHLWFVRCARCLRRRAEWMQSWREQRAA